MQNSLRSAVIGRRSRLVGSAGLSLGMAGLFLWLLSFRLATVDPAAVNLALSGVQGLQWGLAIAATGLSFWAVGRYDAVVHRFFETGVAPDVARRAGICATAVSQLLGLGLITGTILRWRMLPNQPLGLAARVSFAVAVSFLAGWAVVTALVLLAVPNAPLRPAAAVVVGAAVLVGLATIVWPQRVRRWPNLVTQSRLIGLAAVDTIAAALALHVLLPPDLGLTVAALVPAFLIAQGAGLASGAPGGVGAFEVTLLALLPPLPQEPVLAAIVAWRVTYYALPAVLGALLAALGPRAQPALKSAPQPETAACLSRALALTDTAGQHRRLACGSWLAGRTAHVLVVLSDPLVPPASALTGLCAAAGREDRWPAIYKCSGRMAVVARRTGWRVLGVAREAWLDPRSFRLAAASRAGLRRKLRRAEAARVVVSQTSELPVADMDRVAAQWSTAHGGERGFSMGRYTAAHVEGQRVFLAHHGGRLVGFTSFHQNPSEWTLDLMRHGPDTPDGTMQALVIAAIVEAGRLGVPRLSLAAVPEAAFGRSLPLDRALRRFRADGAGLRQFKAAFAPRWQRRYLAAPHGMALLLAGYEIGRAIANPPGFRPGRIPAHGSPMLATEQDPAEYEFASAPLAWHRRCHMRSPTRGSNV